MFRRTGLDSGTGKRMAISREEANNRRKTGTKTQEGGGGGKEWIKGDQKLQATEE